MPIALKQPTSDAPARDWFDYDRCFKDAVAIGLARRDRHRGKSPIPREPRFEQDVIGVVAECAFAKFARLTTEPIYAATNGIPDFDWHGSTIEVKGYGFEPDRPDRKCSLLVHVDQAKKTPSDFYVMWRVNVDDLSRHEPIGWASHHDVVTAPIKVVSNRTNLANYTIPCGELAPIADLKARILSRRQDHTLPGGRVLLVEWTPDKLSARISMTDVAMMERETADYIYRGRNPASHGPAHRWYIASVEGGNGYDTAEDAIAVLKARHNAR